MREDTEEEKMGFTPSYSAREVEDDIFGVERESVFGSSLLAVH